jgi:hypothetical protein
LPKHADQVTAKSLANNKESGSKSMIINAMYGKPKAAAQEAFIKMSPITPAFTALPILGPTGC